MRHPQQILINQTRNTNNCQFNCAFTVEPHGLNTAEFTLTLDCTRPQHSRVHPRPYPPPPHILLFPSLSLLSPPKLNSPPIHTDHIPHTRICMHTSVTHNLARNVYMHAAGKAQRINKFSRLAPLPTRLDTNHGWGSDPALRPPGRGKV